MSQALGPALASVLPSLPRCAYPIMPLIQQVRKKNLTEATELLTRQEKESHALRRAPWNAKEPSSWLIYQLPSLAP